MAIPTRTAFSSESHAVDSLFAATLPHREKEIVDAIFKDDIFLDDLFRKSVKKSGGTFFTTNILMDTSPNVKWIGKGGTLAVSDMDVVRTANWDWRCIADLIVDYRWDRLENQSPEQQFDWVEEKIKTAKKSLRLGLLEGLFGPREPAAGQDTSITGQLPNNIQYLLDAGANGYNGGGTWGTASPLIGQISGADNDWWRHNVIKHAAAFSAGGMKALEKLFLTCKRFGDTPDWLLMGEDVYIDFIEEWRTTGSTPYVVYHSVVSAKGLGGDLGVETPRFHGMRPYQSYFYPDSDGVTAADTRIDMINTEYMPLITRYGTGLYMEGPEKITNQVGDQVYKMAYDIQWINTCPNRHGTLMDIG